MSLVASQCNKSFLGIELKTVLTVACAVFWASTSAEDVETLTGVADLNSTVFEQASEFSCNR